MLQGSGFRFFRALQREFHQFCGRGFQGLGFRERQGKDYIKGCSFHSFISCVEGGVRCRPLDGSKIEPLGVALGVLTLGF